MEKDFDDWNEVKKKIETKESVLDFHERELWWCSVGLNIGVEADGKNEYYRRPILIIKKFN